MNCVGTKRIETERTEGTKREEEIQLQEEEEKR